MNKPLWMPEGSVRALLALLIVGTVMRRVVVGEAVPDEAWVLATLAAAGYGLMRTLRGTS